jgi:hypothetical protein
VIADWEREYLIREWLKTDGNPELSWLVDHLDERIARAESLLTELTESMNRRR